MMEVTHTADCATIIKAFEKHLLSAPTEEAIIGSLTPRVAIMNVNTISTASNLENLLNPPVPTEILNTFNSTATDQPSFSIPEAPERTSSSDINNWQQWLRDCLPCVDRIEFRAELVNNLDDNLILSLENLVNQYLQEISFMLNLLNAQDVYSDTCQFLFSLQGTCIPDLQRIVSLLSSSLYRLISAEFLNIDIMKLLIAPLFQPIFIGYAGLLSQYKNLIVNPLRCVQGDIQAQLAKLKLSGISTGDFTLAHEPFKTLDKAIQGTNNSVGTAVTQLDRWISIGINEVDSLLIKFQQELNSFLGTNNKANTEFLLQQYQKLILFRLIELVGAIIQAQIGGFSCKADKPQDLQDSIAQFLTDFLGPNIPVLITRTDSGDIQLVLNPGTFTPNQISQLSGSSTPLTSTSVIQPSGSVEVDNSLSAIIQQLSQPVTVKPTCIFNSASADANRLNTWIQELEAIGD